MAGQTSFSQMELNTFTAVFHAQLTGLQWKTEFGGSYGGEAAQQEKQQNKQGESKASALTNESSCSQQSSAFSILTFI